MEESENWRPLIERETHSTSLFVIGNDNDDDCFLSHGEIMNKNIINLFLIHKQLKIPVSFIFSVSARFSNVNLFTFGRRRVWKWTTKQETWWWAAVHCSLYLFRLFGVVAKIRDFYNYPSLICAKPSHSQPSATAVLFAVCHPNK